jgi:hypothetical protein
VDAQRLADVAAVHPDPERDPVRYLLGNVLLVERSIARGVPAVDVTLTDAVDHGLDGAQVSLGDPHAEPIGWLRTDTAGLFRLVAGRRTELVERDMVGVRVEQLLMF